MNKPKLTRNWNIAGFIIAKLMIVLGIIQFFTGDDDWYIIIMLGVINSLIFVPPLLGKKK